jgi:hypothetical protein
VHPTGAASSLSEVGFAVHSFPATAGRARRTAASGHLGRGDPRSRFRSPPLTERSSIDTSLRLGRYLLSPLAKRLDDSRYAASISIRSGSGPGMHDRVLRLLPRFDTRHDALHHALRHGVAWVQGSDAAGRPAAAAA